MPVAIKINIGDTYRNWNVIEILPTQKNHRRILCKCINCGFEKSLSPSYLVSYQAKTNACDNCPPSIKRTRSRLKFIEGEIINGFTALRVEYRGPQLKSKGVIAICKCGEEVFKPMAEFKSGKMNGCMKCKTQRIANSMIGRKFGRLTVIDHTRNKDGDLIWVCKCICGNETTARTCMLNSGNKMSCGCMLDEYRIRHKQRNSQDLMSYTLYNRYKKSAVKRGLEFDVTQDFLNDLFLKQERKCALSGQHLTFGPRMNRNRWTTASLDRIDPFKGYLEDNVQWIHKRINLMKHKLIQDEFIELCQMVANHSMSISP